DPRRHPVPAPAPPPRGRLMRFESFVALRYLAASRRRAHVALIAKISIFGLALGVAALIISLALLEGFQDRIRRQMVSRAHLRVTPARGARIADPDRVRTALAAIPGVAAVTPVIEGRGWASDAAGTVAMPVRYRNAPGLDDALGPVARVNASASLRLHSGEGE